ncbi:Hypothetical predicted protein [Marmota monax]|uniref:Uncharacterized protein n=1 Tax=Marmota monax TaxID=9995 RepID=A0A5E4AKE5_MARMO|nr:Hypothetical predicted protein [Marmota monax]
MKPDPVPPPPPSPCQAPLALCPFPSLPVPVSSMCPGPSHGNPFPGGRGEQRQEFLALSQRRCPGRQEAERTPGTAPNSSSHGRWEPAKQAPGQPEPLHPGSRRWPEGGGEADCDQGRHPGRRVSQGLPRLSPGAQGVWALSGTAKPLPTLCPHLPSPVSVSAAAAGAQRRKVPCLAPGSLLSLSPPLPGSGPVVRGSGSGLCPAVSIGAAANTHSSTPGPGHHRHHPTQAAPPPAPSTGTPPPARWHQRDTNKTSRTTVPVNRKTLDPQGLLERFLFHSQDISDPVTAGTQHLADADQTQRLGFRDLGAGALRTRKLINISVFHSTGAQEEARRLGLHSMAGRLGEAGNKPREPRPPPGPEAKRGAEEQDQVDARGWRQAVVTGGGRLAPSWLQEPGIFSAGRAHPPKDGKQSLASGPCGGKAFHNRPLLSSLLHPQPVTGETEAGPVVRGSGSGLCPAVSIGAAANTHSSTPGPGHHRHHPTQAAPPPAPSTGTPPPARWHQRDTNKTSRTTVPVNRKTLDPQGLLERFLFHSQDISDPVTAGTQHLAGADQTQRLGFRDLGAGALRTRKLINISVFHSTGAQEEARRLGLHSMAGRLGEAGNKPREPRPPPGPEAKRGAEEQDQVDARGWRQAVVTGGGRLAPSWLQEPGIFSAGRAHPPKDGKQSLASGPCGGKAFHNRPLLSSLLHPQPVTGETEAGGVSG